MSEDLSTLQSRLAEAREAEHLLVTGAKVVEVTFGNNRRTRYTQANLKELQAYINDLLDKIAALNGTRRRGAIRLLF